VDSSIDRINVRRLLVTMEKEIGGLLENNLYAGLDKEGMLKAAQTYLQGLKSLTCIEGDSKVSNTREATWEDFYPHMPTRLLAIEAVDKHGTSIHQDELPEHLKGYPYKREVNWFIVSADGLERDYYTTDDDQPETELEEGYHFESTVLWKINDPTGMIVTDLLINLTKPVSYLSFTVIEKEAVK
jgi:hypothetical protein